MPKQQARLRRALCVTPDREAFDSLREELRGSGCLADHAPELTLALEAADSSDYDIYIVEHCWLPDGHGIQFCREIRRKDTTTPVLFYSREIVRADISQALAAGAQAYVSFSLDLLPRRVEELVGAAEARDREALREEARCIREHLQANWESGHARKEAAEKHYYEARDRGLRAHALAEFVRAGGRRELFDRLYPSAVEEAGNCVDAAHDSRAEQPSARQRE